MSLIHVDAAVGSKELAPLLAARGLPVEIIHLQFGDLAFVGKGIGGADVLVGIEYKKLPELLASLRSGRLQGHQLPGLCGSYEFRWLLVEGDWRLHRNGALLVPSAEGWKPAYGQFTVAEFQKQLLTLELCGGLRVVHVRSRAQTLQWIHALYSWWTDTALDEHRSHLVIYHPPTLLPLSQFRKTVATLPGIDREKSLRAEQAFGGSLRRAFGASSVEWRAVPGFGDKTVTRVMDAID